MEVKAKKYNIPKGYSLIQTTLRSKEFLTNPVKFISESMDRFSSTYSASLGINKKLIITKNPDFVTYVLRENHKNYKKSILFAERAVKLFGNGLLFSNGEYWLRQRRLVQPAFHRKKLQGLFGIVNKTIQNSLEKIETGDRVDVYPIVQQLSFEVLINSLFDIQLSQEIMNELCELSTEVQDFIIKDMNQPIGRLLYPLTGEKRINFRKSRRLRKIFLDIINERKASSGEYNDILDMILNSRYEDTGETMTEEQMIDELLILIFAGHETTASTLAWLLYRLANNRPVMDKLLNALDGLSIDDCLKDEYLKASISEAMRLYPASWATERVAIEDDEFGEYSFPKDTIIIPFFYGLQRDKDLWEAESEFRPERFIEDPKLVKSKKYFPFGAGPRMCIGNNFAMVEMSFFIYGFLKKFDLQPTDQVPEVKPLLSLRPDEILLSIKER